MSKTYNPKSKKVRRILLSVFLVIGILLSVLITYFPNLNLPSWNKVFEAQSDAEVQYPFAAHFLDVGQADCSLIKTETATILIDAGDVDSFPKIDTYLKQHDVQTIDYLILTHAHADHIGSADDVLYHYDVRNVIMPKYQEENMPTSKVYKNLLMALQEIKPKVIAAKPGSTYEIGDLSFTILAPNATYKEMNNSSVVTRVVYKNAAFLFQGDAEKQSEKDILKNDYILSADVIKLGHHGSQTSSIEPYLKAVHPKFAVISCGLDNSYHLPNESVLKRLEKLNIDYRRTDFHGDIVVYTDGDTLYLETEK